MDWSDFGTPLPPIVPGHIWLRRGHRLQILAGDAWGAAVTVVYLRGQQVATLSVADLRHQYRPECPVPQTNTRQNHFRVVIPADAIWQPLPGGYWHYHYDQPRRKLYRLCVEVLRDRTGTLSVSEAWLWVRRHGPTLAPVGPDAVWQRWGVVPVTRLRVRVADPANERGGTNDAVRETQETGAIV